jgi:hypothetical protein
MRELPKAAKPMAGEEKAIFVEAAKFNGVTPFKEIAALRTRLNDAMRDELSEHGSSQVYRRMTQLRGAVEDVLDGTVATKAAQEAQAVAAGAMSPMAPHDRPLFLQHLEAKAKDEGDLETLRALKEYRELSREGPTSPPKPTDD